MKKVFRLEDDEGQHCKVLIPKDIVEALTLFCPKHNWKVTELPQPTEYCECGNRPRTSIGALNQDITKMDICAICKKKVKPQPKIYSEKEVSGLIKEIMHLLKICIVAINKETR